MTMPKHTGADVLVVDDHPLFRDGLRQMLLDSDAFGSVGEAGNGLEALAYLATQHVDLVLLDLQMPTMDGITAITEIKAKYPGVHILVLTTLDTGRLVHQAIQAGAEGYILKDTTSADLLRSIQAVLAGESALSPAVARTLMGNLREPAKEELTAKEVELLRLVAAGATNKEAARSLFVSEATVKAYLARIYQKFDARDRASAVAEGYRRELLP